MKTEFSQHILTGVYSQVYSRLTLAAINNVFIYYNDLAPILFGIQFSRMDNDQVKALGELLSLTMKMDLKQGRPPLAALYVSRVASSNVPATTFFKEYKSITGKELSEKDWETLVEDIWTQFSPIGL